MKLFVSLTPLEPVGQWAQEQGVEGRCSEAPHLTEFLLRRRCLCFRREIELKIDSENCCDRHNLNFCIFSQSE